MTRARDIANQATTLDVDGGTIKLDGNYPVGTENVALGNQALDDGSLSGAYNTAIGHNSLSANTSGQRNTAVGRTAMVGNTTGGYNTAVGMDALPANTSGSYNTAIGEEALKANTTASNNTAVGYQALTANTTGTQNVAVGYLALDANTTANANTAIGEQALTDNTTGASNTAVGKGSLANNTTASNNTAVGYFALVANTTGTQNVAIGSNALDGNTTGSYNVALGHAALTSGSFSGSNNTGIGFSALGGVTTGNGNTAIGGAAGSAITTGSKNTIVGKYTGNQGGLDIRTSSNYIVLSDGDGNPRMYYHGGDNVWKSAEIYNNTTANAANMYIGSGYDIARSTSSIKYKRDVQDATHGLAEVLQLRPVTYKGKNERDGETVFGGLIAEEVHDAGLTEFVQYAEDGSPDALAYGNMVSLCIKAIQELKAENDALKARVTALETN